MVTNCRQPMLLRSVVSTWLRWGVPVVVSTDDGGADALAPLSCPLLTLMQTDVSAHNHGRALAGAWRVAAERAEWVLRQDDDIIPEFQDAERQFADLRLIPRAASGMRLVDPAGRRWYDWAQFDASGSRVLPYGHYASGNYATGGCQMFHSSLIPVVAASYERNSTHRTASDVKAFHAALAAGACPVSPTENSPTFIHLDPTRMVNRPHPFAQDKSPSP